MSLKTSKPARGNGTGSGNTKAVAAFTPDITKTITDIQSDFLKARYGIDTSRARLTAELMWGRL